MNLFSNSAFSSAATVLILTSAPIFAADATDETIATQRANLAAYAAENGAGPQSPRDLATLMGNNPGNFEAAPPYQEMNLCDIHFHESAEHKGGEFTTFAGNGNGKGKGTGFVYDGVLTDSELTPFGKEVGVGKYGSLEPGDTIEVHYVHTTVPGEPAPGLGSCLPGNDASEEIRNNLKLRVETQVYVIVNDESALDFMDLTAIEENDGQFQAVNLPSNTGEPIQYAGSTTGPGYNEEISPPSVSWSVRPGVAKIHIGSVDAWLAKGANPFNETAAHGVRNLVINPDLISPIN